VGEGWIDEYEYESRTFSTANIKDGNDPGAHASYYIAAILLAGAIGFFRK
jgi:hypothetical protein